MTRMERNYRQNVSYNYRPKTLLWVIENERVSLSIWLSLARDIAAGLAYLHSHDIIHRDVKPANILFIHAHPKLADIGLVTYAVAESAEAKSMVGTQRYMAPEGSGTKQSDVFSLGIVLRELLERCDWDESGESSDQTCIRVGVDTLIRRSIQPNPAERFADGEEMREALESLVQKGNSSGPKIT